MPARRNAPTDKPTVFGFVGSGELDPRMITSMLTDLTSPFDPSTIRFLVPVSREDFSKEIETVVKFAVTKNIPYYTVSVEADCKKDVDLSKVVEGASEDYNGDAGPSQELITLLAEEEEFGDKRLMFFYDDGDPKFPDTALFEDADSKQLTCYDMGAAGAVMSFDDDADPTPEPEPEPVAAPRGRRGSTPSPQPVEEPDKPEDAAEEPDGYTEAELQAMTTAELRKIARAEPLNASVEELKGVDKGFLVDWIITQQGGEPSRTDEPADDADEAQAGVLVEATSFSVDPVPTEEPEPALDEAVVITPVADNGKAITSAEMNAALEKFGQWLLAEIRKPKTPGRPRKDGLPPVPRKTATPAAPTPVSRRRR